MKIRRRPPASLTCVAKDGQLDRTESKTLATGHGQVRKRRRSGDVHAKVLHEGPHLSRARLLNCYS